MAYGFNDDKSRAKVYGEDDVKIYYASGTFSKSASPLSFTTWEFTMPANCSGKIVTVNELDLCDRAGEHGVYISSWYYNTETRKLNVTVYNPKNQVWSCDDEYSVISVLAIG